MARPAAAAARLVLLAAVGACGPTPAAVRVSEPLPSGAPVLVVTAARQKDAIERALRAVGFAVDDRPRQGDYLLRVTLGVDQGARACGTLNNVRYELRRDGRTLIEVEAKGWTGTCEPNVFDDASRALQRQVSESAGKEASR
ncbi:MAG TPA: hypothetical protein VL049_07100 [Candidatus Dormibacteraeota bacterium]|nr:hypothetical protein [Candidatus Dormibacteraeota bacterium]